MKRLLHLTESGVDQTQHFVGLLQFLVDVGMMRNTPSRSIIQSQDQSILAHNSDRREFDGDAGFAVVGIGQQQVFFRNVVSRNPDMTGKFRQDPL